MKKLVLCSAVLFGVGLGSAGAAEPSSGHSMAAAGHAMEAKPGENKGMQQQSCGQMLSGMAGIPAKMAEVVTYAADALDAHSGIMGKEKDKDSMAEAKGMRTIAKSDKQAAANLTKVSEEMKKASSWPATPHDMAKMQSDPKLNEATKKLIEANKELIGMLQKAVADMEHMQKQASAR